MAETSISEDEIIRRTVEHVRAVFAQDSSGHDWWHIYRVWQVAQTIGAREGGDPFVVQMAALLHDLDDYKLFPDADGTPRRALAWMGQVGLDEAVTAHVRDIITGLSFKGAKVSDEMPTLEGKIVQDADRLDAIGAIGIARAFAYGGYKGRALYDPADAPTLYTDYEQYKKNQSNTINHFYEKLLLLRDRIKTPTARQIADQRHAFMEQFLAQFYKEWEGRDLDLAE